jgi:hypothetical protein
VEAVMRLDEVLPLIPATVTAPRVTFRRLLSLQLDLGVLWQILVAVCCVTVLLFAASLRLSRMLGSEPVAGFIPSPFTLAVIEFAVLTAMAVLIWRIGMLFGGTGGLAQSLLAVIWLQTVLNALQVAQLLVMLLSPLLSALIGAASVGLTLVLLTVFIAELHGFRSVWRTFAGVLVGLLCLGVLVMPFLAMTGIVVPEATNV